MQGSVHLVATRERKAQTGSIDQIVLFAPGHWITQKAVADPDLERKIASDRSGNIGVKRYPILSEIRYSREELKLFKQRRSFAQFVAELVASQNFGRTSPRVVGVIIPVVRTANHLDRDIRGRS